MNAAPERKERRGGGALWLPRSRAAVPASWAAPPHGLARLWAGWLAHSLAVGVLVGGGSGLLTLLAERNGRGGGTPSVSALARLPAHSADELAWGLANEGLPSVQPPAGPGSIPFGAEERLGGAEPGAGPEASEESESASETAFPAAQRVHSPEVGPEADGAIAFIPRSGFPGGSGVAAGAGPGPVAVGAARGQGTTA
ncbi:MAG: hypothetical protein HY928_05135, partial [Elusimicrobia bacterium]|nr:hypothetical protein [Elusimicrobiota bacterium]